MNKPSVGWIGLGHMGNPIVHNLLKAGYKVTVHNRTRSKEKALTDVGASAAASPKEVIQQCDIVFTMVSNDAAVKDIYEGADGLLAAPVSGKLLIDMSTVSPATSRHLATQCHKKNLTFLEAPVSGSVKPAQEGTLIILAGGPKQAYDTAKPLFDVIGKLSLHLGDNGAGSAAKLAINYLLGLNLQGLSETILFARQNGIKTEDMLTIINEGACGNGVTKLKGSNIVQQNFTAAFALKHLVKDLRLAGESGLQMPLFSPLYDTYQKALQQGLGEEDAIAIYKYLEGAKDA